MVILNEFEEGSSSTHDQKYDVFLSFRGADTRNRFTDHLYTALKNAGLATFYDDEEITTGERLESAIKASRASIIVLSKNYASSRWCLDELVFILEQKRNFNQIVIPIFYHVEPSHFRNQQGSFRDAMVKHNRKMETETDAEKRSQRARNIDLWKKALQEIADLKGHTAHGRPETEFIKDIVTAIYHRIGFPMTSHLPLLIGMEDSIQFITSWLKDGSSQTADILTILGIGGIGKTALAKYVYMLHCHEFKDRSFIPDISRRCGQQNGLLDVQKQLYSEIFKTSSIQVHDVSKYTFMIEKTLARKNVILVLDDIDSLDQLNTLLGNKGNFHPGSKIIITTKVASLTQIYATKLKLKHEKHELKGLYEKASLELLCRHAFSCNNPKEGYEDVSEKLVKYCDGHPLALEFLGCSLQNKDVAYWEECIQGLKKGLFPGLRIKKALQMSFDTLPSKNDKKLFKHIACFFVGKDRNSTETILEACDINTTGITNLIDRCLLCIGPNNELMMHSLIQQMGRDLVREKSTDQAWNRPLKQVADFKWVVAKGRKAAEENTDIHGRLVVQESSSFSSTHNHIYDVFLSFRGADTRNTFTDHLYKALVEASINTFLKDPKIQSGEHLKSALESAIKASRASVIVLSKNYASSRWCLDELVLILEQHRNFKQIVIPIFYHVDPTDVRNQQNSFGDAMTGHKQRMETETIGEKKSQLAEKMEMWKNALTEVSDLEGHNAQSGLETSFIEQIVSNIQHKLSLPLRSTEPGLIRVDYYIRFISSWLNDGSTHTADILTIFGMSGIGKTFLAKYIYGLHCHLFQRSSFIDNIDRNCSELFNKLLDLQKQLCADIFKQNAVQVNTVSEYTSIIENALASKKVLLVLDDFGSFDQLEALLGNKGFHPGSKIIITTKEAFLTERFVLFNLQVHSKHTTLLLEGLSETSSLQLLSFHAFNCISPKEGYKQVSEKLVKICKGHPLVLKVLARSLNDRDVAEWEECVEKLHKETDSPIEELLRMCFDSLPSQNDKELFKHIACFFVGKDRDSTETILKACGMSTVLGIRNLLNKCLLVIGPRNELMMHQLLQDMGRDVVRQESPKKPWKRSLLWYHKESFEVLKQKKGTEYLKGLVLDMRMLEKEKLQGSIELRTDAFDNMDNLMMLQLNYVQLSGSYEKFPKTLRWLCMHGFPLKSIPSDLQMENLVVLDMSYSNIESFGMSYGNPQPTAKRKELSGSHSKDKRLLGSLKILDLSFCEHLISLGGFWELPALERLIVKNCKSLIDVCESVEQCDKLLLVDLSYCSEFRKFAKTIDKLKNVKTLLLDGCNLGELSFTASDMDSQTSSFAIVEGLPRDLMSFTISLPRSLVSLSLARSNLSNESFPMDLSSLSMLTKLYLSGNPIVSMPSCVRTLPRLEYLDMRYCETLMSIDQPPPTLTKLSYRTSYSYPHNLLRKIEFDPEMSPLKLKMNFIELPRSSIEIEGVVKIQAMEGVEENVLRSLGWSNLDFIKERRVQMYDYGGGRVLCRTQMYYEFGIFSTIYGGEEMPNWIEDSCEGPLISFTIPSSSSSPSNRRLRGLNLCYVQAIAIQDWNSGFRDEKFGYPVDQLFELPVIEISNITKNRTWIYEHYINERVNVGGMDLTFISHWMLGMDDMEAGDQVTIIVKHYNKERLIKKCGVSFVYEDGDNKEEEEAALGYYKSWNHIIGGDLSPFQLTTGEYFLDIHRFTGSNFPFNPFTDVGVVYKDKFVYFKALSQRKSNVHGRAIKDVTK